MTDTTTTDQPDQPEQPAGVEATPAAEVGAQAAAGEPIPFWHRPYVERYLVPLVLPVAVVVGIVVYVLNVSRLFLSAHGHIPVAVVGPGWPAVLAPIGAVSGPTLFPALPAIVLWSVFGVVLTIVAVASWFVALTLGRTTAGLQELGMFCLRYQLETEAYVLLLTGSYPRLAPAGPTTEPA